MMEICRWHSNSIYTLMIMCSRITSDHVMGTGDSGMIDGNIIIQDYNIKEAQ